MKRKSIFKAIIAIAVAMAFVMPVAAFANVGTIGVISNSENTNDMEIMVESTTNSDTSGNIESTTNSDTSDNIESTIDAEKPVINTEELAIVNDANSIVSATGKTIYVDDDRPPEWYNETQVKTIQDGVDNADAGDTVYVYNGTYYETVIVYKQLDLIGESRENVIVDGGGTLFVNVFKVTVNYVSIDTFTIRNGDIASAGIYLEGSSNCTITNCVVQMLYQGIYLKSSSYNNIANCDLYNNNYGIRFYYSSDNNITNCNVYNNENYGINFWGSSNNDITNCNIYNNGNYGFYLDGSSNSNDITNCDVYNNNYGIYLKSSSYNNITNCYVYNNENRGIYLKSSSNTNLIHHNNFINAQNAYDACSNIWNNSYPSGGNYWGDYSGVDGYSGPGQNISGGDGIGDTPYSIPGGSNQDGYPLMQSVGPEDIQSPIIINVETTPPICQLQGGWVNITCYVRDDKGIDTVKVNIDGPTGFTPINTTMNGEYVYYYNITYSTLGLYQYFIWANDTSGKISMATSLYYRFYILVTLPVHNIDTGEYFSTIQSAIDDEDTVDGNTITAHPIIYLENVIIDKSVNLIGDSREDTIIDGGGSGTVVRVDEGIYEASISTFTIRNGQYGVLLDYESSDNIVTNCDITDFTRYGIYIYEEAYYNTVTNCDVYNSTGSSHGICLSECSYDNVVTNCNIYNIKYHGIATYYDSSNEISNCNIYNVGSNGIELCENSGYTVTNCSVYNCGTGISINDWASDHVITDCSVHNNEYGITIFRSSNMELSGNTIYDNDYNLLIEGEIGEDWESISYYNHVIDPTNTVDGKSIYYLVEYSDITIDETHNFGYLGLISCTNIIAKNGDVNSILMINTTDSTISNVDSHNSGIGIYLWKSSNNDIIDCNVYSNRGSGMFFSESSHNDIINCENHNNGGVGFELYKSSNNNFMNCDLYNNNYGINIRSSSNNNIVTNCNVYNGSNGIILEESSNNNIIMSCNVYNNSRFTWTGRGIYITGSSNNDIINCNSYNNQYGIYLSSSKNCELRGNTIYDNDYNFVVEGQWADLDYFRHVIDPANTVDGKSIYYLVEQSDITIDETDNFGYLGMISCTNITAKNSDVTGILVVNTTNSAISNVDSTNCKQGIQISKSSYNDIINCDAYNNEYGIRLYHASNNTITNCDVYDNIYESIYLSYSSNNNIANCTIYNTFYYNGIYLHYSCSNNNIANCTLYNNGNGFRLYSECSNNIITNCSIYNNNMGGIQILSNSIDNLIYHNNFANNIIYNGQSSGNNQWDNGDEGNYWDDYRGVDEDGDGIGDTPYNISGGSNQDRYPLMIPLDDTPPVITDVQATPEVQSITEPVNITCTVTDNWGLVDIVKINITGPEGFALETTMNEGSYYYEDTYTTMGVYYYFIWANDTNGNIATSDTYSFVITDLDMPMSAVVSLPTWETAVPFDVTATAFDNTGVATVTLWYQYSSNGIDWTDWTAYGTDTEEPWSWSFTGSDGYYEFYSIAIDDYGNVEDPPSAADASTGIDTVPPVTTIILDGTLGGNGWYISNVTVTLAAIDNLSGVSSIWYKIDTGTWQLYSTPFTVSSDDEHIIQYYSFDIAGNIEDANSIDVKIDKTSPVTEHEFEGIIGEDGWFVSDVTVTLSATDAVSGLNYTMYKLNDGAWITYVEPFIVTEDGDYTLYYYSVDLAGNTETTKEVDFKIEHDVLPPVTTHEFEGDVGDNSWYTSNVVVTLTAEDDSSGVDYTMYKLDDDDWQKYTAILVIEDGEHTITYYSVDRVGNKEEDKGPFGFKIDQIDPTINLTAEKTGITKWLLTATVSDETSGIAKVEFYLAGEFIGEVTEPPYEWTCSGQGPAQAIVYDNAGNKAISEEVTPHSQSPSQSSSNSVVQKNIMSNPEATGDPKAELDVGRVWLRGLLWHCNRVGNVNHALALRLHYIEFTGTERTAGIVTDNHVIFKDSAYTGRMYEVGTGLFTYIIGFFEGGLEIL